MKAGMPLGLVDLVMSKLTYRTKLVSKSHSYVDSFLQVHKIKH